MTNQGLSKREIILFARQLSLAISSDISLIEGIEIIMERTDHLLLQQVLQRVLERLQLGQPFFEAIEPEQVLLTPYFVAMVQIGEQSGNLPELLTEIADSYEKQLEAKDKLKSAITYPLILTGLMFGVIVLLVVQVMPMFHQILDSLGGEMPSFTRRILSISLFLNRNGWLILGILLIIVVGLMIYHKTEAGREFFDRVGFKIPIQRQLISCLLASRFARSLGILIKSGISYSEAFELIKPTIENRYVEAMLERGNQELKQGSDLDEVLTKMNLFPWLLTKLFAVAAKTGQMDKALLTAADEMEKELGQRMERLSTVVEPILIIILSIIVGIILISVVLPVVSIMNSI